MCTVDAKRRPRARAGSRGLAPGALPVAMLAGALAAPVAVADFAAGERAARIGDFDTAHREFRAEADAGNHRAQALVADMYRRGLGVRRDYRRALEWYARAAAGDDAAAQYNLGVMYRQGLGTEPDEARASALFLRSALLGHIPAQINLGLRYAAGEGLPRNPVEGYAWLHRAAQAGSALAVRKRTALERLMTREQVRRARDRARELL